MKDLIKSVTSWLIEADKKINVKRAEIKFHKDEINNIEEEIKNISLEAESFSRVLKILEDNLRRAEIKQN